MLKTTNHHPDCIDRIVSTALNSIAVNHQYLDDLQSGELPNMQLALQDLAFQYSFYSSEFTRYVTAVIKNTRTEKHKNILMKNLAEESGDTHNLDLPNKVLASIDGVPHSELYDRFQRSLGIDDEYRNTFPPTETVLLWRRHFLQICQLNLCVGIGAIGIDTELLVPIIYTKFLEAIKSHTDLSPDQYVFFDLHSECDKEHADQILLIAKDLAVNPEACEQIEYGAKMATQMRSIFWDKMHERAFLFSDEKKYQMKIS